MDDKSESHVTGIDRENASEESTSRDNTIFGSNAPPRTLKALDILSAGFNVCNSWCGVAATMFLGFLAGGPVTIIYGVIISFFTVGCCALSMCELAARYPTAGGQYHWTYLLAPKSIRRGASYTTGIVNIFAWLATCASVCVIIPQVVLGMAAYWHPTYVPARWHTFLIYQGSNILVLAYNLLILRRAPLTHDIGMFFSLACFATFFIACLARASPKASTSFVWTTFVNEGSGWPNGVVFLTGLVNPHFMYVGIDGAVHLAEDALNAASAVPKALIATILIGFFTTFPFVVAMFYCISDPMGVVMSPLPIFAIWEQATRSGKGATAMTVFLLLTGYFALNATQQTASRLTWSFARDNGLVFSGKIGTIDSRLGVPVWALFFNATIVFIMGCIYLGSTTAFNSIIGTCLISLHISIAIPVFFLMLGGRDRNVIGADRRENKWHMGAVGWLVNFVTIAWTVLISVFYCFPAGRPVSGSTMNYASAVLGVLALLGVVNWFVYANRRFTGPRIELRR
ncbi:hypothetical protein PMZ80_000514 [Knufia obscura]|uniref:Amino acid transporter n=2 Tax=Knufia TaxID=430999 RepID=A0AAN8EQH7_9EURO|nr:hypothetical protein PMZ80_000514 [Knufia obscura]KAK5956558.1 hypothetical protein OHC33_002043 [Knufia fluminis]